MLSLSKKLSFKLQNVQNSHFQGERTCSKLSLSGLKNVQDLIFQEKECSQLSLSGLKKVEDSHLQGWRMFKTLTSRVQKWSRFSLSGSKNVQMRFSLSAWKKNVWTKFCVSGKNLDVQKSEFQGRNFCWDLKVSSNGKSSVQVACTWGKVCCWQDNLGSSSCAFLFQEYI